MWTMCHPQNRASVECTEQFVGDKGSIALIEMFGRLIEQHDRMPGQKDPSHSYPLTLTSGDLTTLLTYMTRQTVNKTIDPRA